MRRLSADVAPLRASQGSLQQEAEFGKSLPPTTEGRSSQGSDPRHLKLDMLSANLDPRLRRAEARAFPCDRPVPPLLVDFRPIGSLCQLPLPARPQLERKLAMRLLPALALASLGLALPSSGQHVAYSVLREPDGIFTSGLNETFGRLVTTIGDLDGDGRRDFLTLDGPTSSGSAYNSVIAVSTATGDKLYTSPTIHSNSLPFQVIAIGDVTGDGIEDWAASTTDFALLGLIRKLRVSLFSGADGSFLRELGVPPSTSGLGFPIASIGDINGDGLREVLVLDPLANRNSADMGEAYVYSGSDGSLLRVHTGYSSQVFTPITPFGFDVNPLSAVAGLDDVDGDGVDDYAIAAPRALGGRGKVHVFSGSSGVLLFEILGTSANTTIGIGWHLALIGDANLDGVDDLLVSSPTPGGFEDAYTAYSGRDGSTLYTVQYPLEFLHSSKRVADWDFDGQDELFISNGAVVNVHAAADGSLEQVIQRTELGDQPIFSVEAGIDLEGDGQAELVIATRREVTPAPFPGADPTYGPLARINVLTKLDIEGSLHCFGDVNSVTCPCGNWTPAATGCMNSVGNGASLQSLTLGAEPGSVELNSAGLPPGSPALLFAGMNRLPTGGNSPLGDGALCINGPLQRVAIRQADAQGNCQFPAGLDLLTAWQAGEERNFQAWYRDANGPCASGSNLTNAYRQYWLP